MTRNFLVDRTAGSLELMRQDGVTGSGLVAAADLSVGAAGHVPQDRGRVAEFFLPGFHPWNEDDRHLLGAYAKIASGTEPRRKVRRAA